MKFFDVWSKDLKKEDNRREKEATGTVKDWDKLDKLRADYKKQKARYFPSKD